MFYAPQVQRGALRTVVAGRGRTYRPVRAMATAAPEHNRDKVTKKVFFDMEIGGQPAGVFAPLLVLKHCQCLLAAIVSDHIARRLHMP